MDEIEFDSDESGEFFFIFILKSDSTYFSNMLGPTASFLKFDRLFNEVCLCAQNGLQKT